MITRRNFLATSAAAGAASAIASQPLLAAAQQRSSAAVRTTGKSEDLFLPVDDFQPATVDRLPLEWNKRTVKRLQEKLAAEEYEGILLTDRWNVIYFTGLWHSTTERLFYAFIPTKGEEPIWFYPALDRDLVKTWWGSDGDMYFDWHHAEGGFPHEGKVQMGAKVDLFEWVMKGLKKRGFAGKKLAVDKELVPSEQAKVVNVLRQPMGNFGPPCLDMRIRKTPEELALIRRTYTYFNRIHAFARDLLLEKGTDLNDFDISSAANKYGTDLILGDLKKDGGPHTAVGVTVNVACRTGRATAYPHPNQFLYNKVKRGDALQVSGVVYIGGCGGELYRPYLLNAENEHMKKVWTVNRDCCMMQKAESVAGVTCSTVAYKIHKYQVEHGVAPLIYHRPAHGEGMEGHQAPWLALGDHSMLEPGMCFSVEPGLFDTANGFGTNFSDKFVIQEKGPARPMSRLPWSEEWCWVKL
ncbi:MAG: M24 family metallopeptidase [Pirellulales bacterium]